MWMKRTVSGCAALALGLVITGSARAQSTNDKAVYFTFSQPVSVPQKTLPAGRYLFRMADTILRNTVVQVYNDDGSQLQAMFMTIPIERAVAAEDPEVRFLETAANRPAAISSYWYPGERTGWEFVYPREQARQLAQSAKTNVLTTSRDVTADNARSNDFVRVSPSGEEMPVTSGAPETAMPNATVARGERAANVPDLTPRTTGATTTMAQNNQNNQATAPRAAQTERTALPATASTVPAMTFAGLVAAFAFVMLRSRRARA